MLVKFFKIFLILLLYQSPLYSKNTSLNDFNARYLSNYFSGIVAYENLDNTEALKFFNSSKILIKQHDAYLERYVFSLVLDGKVKKAINQVKQNSTKNNFEIDGEKRFLGFRIVLFIGVFAVFSDSVFDYW